MSTEEVNKSQTAWEQRHDAEKQIQRNPHPDFKKVEGERPDWSHESTTWVKTPRPDWKPGQGGNDGGASLQKAHVEIEPYAPGREPRDNYKLLISAISPRFIGFISTLSLDGKYANLAPYSYTTVINHDPPLFTIGHAGGKANAKDTLKNLLETGECVINVVSEHFIEAANATSINAPFGISEWAISGLHPASSSIVKPSRVKESIFSVECRLVDTREFQSRSTPGKISSTLIIVEGVKFWAREDAINDQRNLVDPDVLRPMTRMGGITYGRTTQRMELPRPDFADWEKTGLLNGLTDPEHIN